MFDYNRDGKLDVFEEAVMLDYVTDLTDSGKDKEPESYHNKPDNVNHVKSASGKAKGRKIALWQYAVIAVGAVEIFIKFGFGAGAIYSLVILFSIIILKTVKV